jgi:hypothetical protein
MIEELPPLRIYRLKLKPRNDMMIHVEVEREPGMNNDLFNAMVAAIAQKYDAQIIDIEER